FVDVIDGVAAGGQGDDELFAGRLKAGLQALVDCANVHLLRLVDPYLVEESHRHRVALAVDFWQLDLYQGDWLKNARRKEKGGRVKAAQDAPLVALDHRLELKGIAYQQHLLAAEG